MKRVLRMVRGWDLQFFLLATLLLSAAGCASPRVIGERAKDLDKYRKIYLGIPEEDPRKVFPRFLARLKQCGFEVVEVKSDGPTVDAQASGFVITPQGHLLTAAHAVQGNSNTTAWINGSRFPAKVLATDTNLDVAMLQLEADKPFSHLIFSGNTNYQMGQDAFTMGFPMVEVLGTSPRLNKGLVSSTVGLEDNPKQLQFSAEIQPGNSGGPLLDSGARVIGLVISTLNPFNVFMRSGGNLPQNVNFAVKNGPILEFLKHAGVELPPLSASPATGGFEAARDSLAIVRAGSVRDEDLTAPSLVCLVSYISFWDVWYRFRAFEVEFRDAKTGKSVFKAGQYRDNPFSSEDGVMDRTFREIHANFFPNRQNPFGETKEKKPTPEPE